MQQDQKPHMSQCQGENGWSWKAVADLVSMVLAATRQRVPFEERSILGQKGEATMGLTKLHAAIRLIVERANRPVLRTQLVKLLYLADLTFYRAHGRSISGCTYTSYHYGPYSDEIIAAARDMAGVEIEEDSGVATNGNSYYLYRPGPLARPGMARLAADESKVLCDVVDQFADKDLDDLLAEVYKTREFSKTAKGNVIALG